jgi:putative protease
MAKIKKSTKKTAKKAVKKVLKKIVKKSVKKSIKKDIRKSSKIKPIKKAKEGKLIGKISHYFSNIEVVVINLVSPLKIGETIRIVGGEETDFEQKIVSMQIEHKEVRSGKKGDSVGVKVKEKVHEGYRVYKTK